MNQSKSRTFRAFFAMGALATAAAAFGCVADRPSRNGVFNENQYLRKEFLVGAGDGSQSDPGWFLKATVLSVSTPNPLGPLGIFPGADTGFGTGLAFIRFRVTQDKLQMINVREIAATPSVTRTEEVVNAWPITNVDLKYRVNLDGEKTNFYEENQELDWQVRQWVKINFAKNDMSDTAPLGGFVSSGLAKCTDLASASATLVPNTFTVEEHSDNIYLNNVNWVVNITVPVKYDDADCVTSYGGTGVTAAQFGRQNVSFNLMYSMVRAKQVEDPQTNADAYVPMEVSEKDPIRHKYGVFNIIPMNRDVDPTDPNNSTQLISARQLVNRWNPNKPIVYYFSPGVPDYIKDSFRRTGGIKDVTNAVFQKAGAKATVDFLNWNDATAYQDGKGPERQFGDVRYSFIRWIDDLDANQGFLGYGPNASDPRTGEILQGTINLANYVQQELAYQIDFFLKTVGASYGLDYTDAQGNAQEWPQAACNVGDVQPLKQSVLAANHNGNSTLYNKMQQYLQLPATTYGNLGPEDFTTHQDADFFNAYYSILPYQLFADPDANPFVIREGGAGIYGPANYWELMAKETQFQKIAASIDRGISPFEDVSGPDGLKNAVAFHNMFKDLTTNHKKLEAAQVYNFRQMAWDPPSAFDFVQIMVHSGRHCILGSDGKGRLETKQEWITDLTHSFYDHISIHEFGHTLGLQHNFMGSVDKNNWPVQLGADGKTPVKDANGNLQYTLYTSSQMEYNVRGADMFNTLQWGKYDQGALGWIYSNAQNKDQPLATDKTPKGDSISGQSSSTAKAGAFTAPWKDPYGFDDKGAEIQYLYCHHEHITYTPLCRTFDAGSVPSEIVANAIEGYEWNFNFTNYRVYRKFWNNTNYASIPAGLIVEMRRFLSLWLFDWGSSELADALRRIGIKNPDANGSDLQYFTSLTNKFNAELSSANKMVAAFHKAIIAQSTGERPVRTVYDTYYGDVTQQGIILDKLFAMQGWVALWPSDNYDQNQAGSYISSYSDAPDSSYQYNAEDTVDFMLGGQYDAFPYFAPLAVAAFAQDTHSPAFNGRIEVRNWIGGHVFYRLDDFLSYFRDLAVQSNKCDDVATCAYDPRLPSTTTQTGTNGVMGGGSDTHNEFFGPDQRLWIWAYIADRNTWVAVQKEINTAAYVIVRNYTDDVIFQLDDGAFPGGAFGNELPMKYYLDSFNQFN